MRIILLIVLLGIWSGVSSVYATGNLSAKNGAMYDPDYESFKGNAAHLSCHFIYPANSVEIHKELGDNATALAQLDSFVYAAITRPYTTIKRIRLTGYSSIEGTYIENEILARKRVESFYRYLTFHYPSIKELPCDRAWVGEDWAGLTQLVRNSDLPERNEVLAIIRQVSIFDGREGLIMKLNGGRPYKEMVATMFPLLRRVEIEVDYEVTDTPLRLPEAVSEEHKKETVEHTDTTTDLLYEEPVTNYYYIPGERRKHKPILGVKTNLLSLAGVMYDGSYTTSLPNLALEYYVGNNWSVEIGGAYAYWHYKSHRSFQGMSGYRLEPRYYFMHRDNNLNIYVGLYSRVGDYDIYHSDKESSSETYTTTGYTGKYWDTGLSAGLYLRLARTWGLELGARGGYVNTRAKVYVVEDNTNYLEQYHNYNKFRITDLNVSLVYRFSIAK